MAPSAGLFVVAAYCVRGWAWRGGGAEAPRGLKSALLAFAAGGEGGEPAPLPEAARRPVLLEADCFLFEGRGGQQLLDVLDQDGNLPIMLAHLAG